jgi:hypothetical protein
MSNITNQLKTNKADFRVSVVYGFKNKLQIVLLGEITEGMVEASMSIYVRMSEGTAVGKWEISEILNMDFINGTENKNFIGLVVICKDEQEFKLLQSLRVYDETVMVQ